MQPGNFYFGGGTSDTVMHPLVALAMVLGIILILVLPRRLIIIPFLLSAFLIPVGQTLVLGGVHLYVLRIIILFACARMLAVKLSARSSIFGTGLDSVDKVFALWAVLRALAFVIQFSFQSAAVVNQVAFLLDVFGGYFLLRFMIRDAKDMQLAVVVLAVVVAILGPCMIYEKLHGRNIFGYLGGVRLMSELRDGSVRAQGPFEHPILAGSFAATLIPLFLWLWYSCNKKWLASAGVIGSTLMVLSAASSTPLLAYVAGIGALCFWPLRKHMRAVRWGLLIVLVALNVVMKASVWFLIARIDLTGASSGYHRAMLVDTFIRHFGEWWMVGTSNNASWGFDMWDTSNQFIQEGVNGGLVTLACFIVLISMSFGKIGRARRAVSGDQKQEWFFWFLGAALFSHIVAFWGISYFDHTQISWFALLAMIAATTGRPITRALKQSQMVGQTSTLQVQPAYVPTVIPAEKTGPFSVR